MTVNENGGKQPFEVFINTAKAGSETAAVSEAIGRLISYILRLASPVEPRDRLKEIVRQLSGIGGGRSLGFGPNRVRSLPDGVAQLLSEYLENSDPHGEELVEGAGDNGYHPAAERLGVPDRSCRSGTCARSAGRRRWSTRRGAGSATPAGIVSVSANGSVLMSLKLTARELYERLILTFDIG